MCEGCCERPVVEALKPVLLGQVVEQRLKPAVDFLVQAVGDVGSDREQMNVPAFAGPVEHLAEQLCADCAQVGQVELGW